MIAHVRMTTTDPWKKYAIIIEIVDGDRTQIYRHDWSYADSQYRHGIDDEGDPRRPMGKALEELGRSLQAGHGHDLIDERDLRGT